MTAAGGPRLAAALAGLSLAIAAGIPRATADATGPLGFRPGFEPLVGATMEGRNADCGSCHVTEAAELQGSRHESAWTNHVFQAGFIAESRMFCVSCHAPRAEQAAEIVANRVWYQSRDPHGEASPIVVEKRPEPEAAHGIDCLSCHVRDGEVMAAAPTRAAHPIRVEPRLSSSAFCKDCHEFQTPRFMDGQMVMTAVPMQSTWSEWAAWVEKGAPGAPKGMGEAPSCQSCHMPSGAHTFRGAHDLPLLRGSLDVDVSTKDGVSTWTLRSVGTGHSLPTGDLFRHLTLEVQEDAGWKVVGRYGRTFRIDGEGFQQLDADTSLQPGVPVRVTHAAAPWRVRYHYGSEKDERRGMLAESELYALLAEGG